MFRTQCNKHNFYGQSLCASKETCTDRIICPESSCYHEHSHGSYKVEIIMMDLIRAKRVKAKRIADSIMSVVEDAFNKCRKNIQIALSCFLNQSHRIRDFDLNQITFEEINEFMRADHNDSLFRTELDKLSAKLSSQTNAFREQCYKRFKQDKNTPIHDLGTSQDVKSKADKKDKKKKKEEQRVILVNEPKMDFITTYYLSTEVQGLRRMMNTLASIEHEETSMQMAEQLFEFLRRRNLQIKEELYVGSKAKYELGPCINALESYDSTLLIIQCETLLTLKVESSGGQSKPIIKVYGLYCKHGLYRAVPNTSQEDCMFELTLHKCNLFQRLPFHGTKTPEFSTIQVINSSSDEVFKKSLSIGLGEIVIPNRYNKYLSRINKNGIFNLGVKGAIKIKEMELYLITSRQNQIDNSAPELGQTNILLPHQLDLNKIQHTHKLKPTTLQSDQETARQSSVKLEPTQSQPQHQSEFDFVQEQLAGQLCEVIPQTERGSGIP